MKASILKLATSVMLLIAILTTGATSLIAQASLAEVKNLKVTTTGNKSVTLSWDKVANATGYKVLYGTNSVGSDEEYNRPPIDAGNVNTFTVSNLTNGTKYYFSVIATNGATLSQYYSNEVEATPNATGANAGPTVTSASADSLESFELKFSKAMSFPADLKAAISIKKSFDNSVLAVKSATKIDDTTVKVTTDIQSEGSEYIVSLTDQFKDTAGVSMAPNERTAILIGYAGENLFAAADDVSSALKILEVIPAPDKKAVELVFSGEVTLGANPTSQVAIVETSNPENTLTVSEVIQNPNDKKKVLVRTAEQKDVSYTILVTGIKDASGTMISEANSTIEFSAGVGGEAAAGSLADITSLEGKMVDLAALIVNLTWGASPDFEKETFAGYNIYFSTTDEGGFSLLQSTGDDEFTTESLPAAERYLFKVTTLDKDGNESLGKIVELPGTGPAGLAMLAMGSLGLGRIFTIKK